MENLSQEKIEQEERMRAEARAKAEKEIEKRKKQEGAKKVGIGCLAILIIFVVLGLVLSSSSSDNTTKKETTPTTKPSIETVETVTGGEAIKTENLEQAPSSESVDKQEVTKPQPVSIFKPKDEAIAIIKASANEKWSDDYSMVQYEIGKQVEAYDWLVQQSKYPEIMAKAKQKWGDDYSMVQYEYSKQVEAYEAL